MRIYLKLTPNKEPVPFDHQHLLTGAILKWLGINREHGKVSRYTHLED